MTGDLSVKSAQRRCKIAAYCRVSTEKEAQLESLENQKLFFTEFAKKNNNILVHIYADEGISGKQMKNRKAFLQMLKDAEKGMFDMVVVKDISRFARNTVDFLNAIRQLKQQNIEVCFLSNNQTVLENSEFVLTIFSALAQEESANLSKRVKFGKKINAERGRVPNLIFGYDKIDTFTLTINEKEAQIVRKVFDYYVNQGYGFRKIALALTEDKVSTKKGGLWCSRTVKRMLSNPIYIGIMENHKYEVVDYISGKRKDLPAKEFYTHQRPELKMISEEIFYQAQEIMADRTKQFSNMNLLPHGRYSSRYLFSTLIHCESCGYCYYRRQYHGKKISAKWVCSGHQQRSSAFCSNNFVIDEASLIAEIENYFSSIIHRYPDFWQKVFAEYHQSLRQTQSFVSREELLKRADKIEGIKEKYKRMYTEDIITLEELKEKTLTLQKEKQSIEKQMENFSEIQEITASTERANPQIIALSAWTNIDLRSLVEKIQVSQTGSILIYLKEL